MGGFNALDFVLGLFLHMPLIVKVDLYIHTYIYIFYIYIFHSILGKLGTLISIQSINNMFMIIVVIIIILSYVSNRPKVSNKILQ